MKNRKDRYSNLGGDICFNQDLLFYIVINVITQFLIEINYDFHV